MRKKNFVKCKLFIFVTKLYNFILFITIFITLSLIIIQLLRCFRTLVNRVIIFLANFKSSSSTLVLRKIAQSTFCMLNKLMNVALMCQIIILLLSRLLIYSKWKKRMCIRRSRHVDLFYVEMGNKKRVRENQSRVIK